MKSIIGCDIQNLINWLYFTEQYNVNERENLDIEHLNSSFNFQFLITIMK